jgi:ferredoxin-NADP reductase/uncharacterized protein YcbX
MISFLLGIYRYPLKGFQAQRLNQAQLLPKKGLAFDRRFAITNAQLATMPDGDWTACQAFVRLTKNKSLALFDLAFDDSDLSMALRHPNGEIIKVKLDDQDSLQQANTILQRWFPGNSHAVHGAPQLALAHADTGYWDHKDAAISIINAASVAQLALATGQPIDPARFRGNFLIAGLPAWQEFQWLGRRVKIGDAILEMLRPIDRCTATSINPTTGEADINLPALLARQAGHVYCGIYARVIVAGQINAGDQVQLMGASPGVLIEATKPSTAPTPADWPRMGLVHAIERSSQSVLSFWIKDPLAVDGINVPFQPGQHIRLHALGNDAQSWRSYTVSDRREDGSLRISIKRDSHGECSKWLHDHLEVGSSVAFSGPFGEFTLQGKPLHHITLLSAGIGITPIAAMLKQLAQDYPNTPLKMVHVSRSKQDLALWPEVLRNIRGMPHAQTQLHLSDEKASPASSEHPFISAEPNLKEMAQTAAQHNTQVFICGPAGFTREAIAQLTDAGVPSAHIHHESFASPKANAGLQTNPPHPGPFKVNFLRSGRTAVWTEQSGSLLDLAESCGIQLPANCRSGACKACKQMLQSGSVAYTTEPLTGMAENWALMCCSVPVSNITISA